uniref:ABC transporter ATP-binding protein n=1 Tax=Fervidobacterium thailandense TaxID=1008305 RepID=A0A7C4VSU8_9BACT
MRSTQDSRIGKLEQRVIKLKLLEIRNLKVYFNTEEGIVKALEDVNLEIDKGEILGLVGETGCGKSVTVLTVLRLLSNASTISGQVLFEGQDLLKLSEKEMLKIRGKEITMIFQEPMTSLNPVFTVGQQLMDVIQLHMNLDKKRALERAIEVLKLVKLPDPDYIVNKYPHELSGGMRQRVMIAMAISCEPKLIIADEPTTALDVTIQAQILGILKHLKEQLGVSILIITHNLGVVAQICDRVAVMYSGYVIETGTVAEIFQHAVHPYTRGLLKAIPPIEEKVERLNVIPGNVPNLITPPSGCRFHPRCERYKDGVCNAQAPSLRQLTETHTYMCYNPYLPEGVVEEVNV